MTFMKNLNTADAVSVITYAGNVYDVYHYICSIDMIVDR